MTILISPVTIQGDLAVITFNRFDLDGYRLFLRSKKLPEKQINYDWRTDTYTLTTQARFAHMLGVELDTQPRARLPIAEHLFDYQRWAVDMALGAKRFALWLDTGLGKMACALEWARQVMALTDGRVLIFVPSLALIRQYQRESERFYQGSLPIEALPTREALEDWLTGQTPALGVATYHKLIPGELSNLRRLAGLVADEASILKTGGGVIKWNLIHSAKGIEYKLSLTATPAPNEAMEYASQGSFLEKLRSDNEVIWTYFTDDKFGNWKIKDHARADFYRFLSAWSLYMRDPAAFGFNDILASLPAPDIHEERVALTEQQQEILYIELGKANAGMIANDKLPMTTRSKLMQAARGFQYLGKGSGRGVLAVDSHKPARVAEWVTEQVYQCRPTLIWTTFDEEGAILLCLLADKPFRTAILDGSMDEEERAGILDDFRAGHIHALISKPQLIGYGLNLQFVKAMCFSGFDDSFERIYQATRRAVRFGQTDRVQVFIPYVPELEGLVFSNIRHKERRFMEEVAIQEKHYRNTIEELAL